MSLLVAAAALALGLSPSDGSSRERLVQEFLETSKAVGVSVAIADPTGEWQHQAGHADLEANRPVEPTTLFRLASISKPVAAVSVMRLVENRKLNLDKGIAAYIPGYPDQKGAITLRRVLSHTAGIRSYKKGKNDAFFEPLTTDQAVDHIRNDELVNEPGTEYFYSTHAFALAAAAVETASGSTYRDFLRKNISRWGSPSLDIEISTETKPERTALYSLSDDKKPMRVEKREDISWKAGGGGLEATAADLARFGLAVQQGRLLAKREVSQMWTQQKLKDGKKLGYGLGWDLGVKGLARHGGGQQGCSSFLLVDRDRGVSVAVMCNTSGVGAGDLAAKLHKDWIESMPKSR